MRFNCVREVAMLDSGEERLARLAKMAFLYYKEGKNQSEIAEALGVARPMVSRQLKEAEELGIVKVNVDYPFRSARLEALFKERYGLAEPRIHIIDPDDANSAKALIGLAAAKYLSRASLGVRRIGVSWGSTLFEMIRHLEPVENPCLEVVQLIGATGHENNPSDGPLIAQGLAEKLDAKAYLLHAPLVVESELVRNALMNDRVILETLDRARDADIAFVGLGCLEREKNSLFKAGYLSDEELDRLRKAGAVGDTCAQFFDAEGRILDIDVNHRVIGLPLTELSKIPKVIAVSLGEEKARGILGALRGKRITGLITDQRTALRVLALDGCEQNGED
jgi:deoxyribonucleoside regulator